MGLDIAKPPDLLYLFRNYSTCALSDKEKIDRITQLVSSAAGSGGAVTTPLATPTTGGAGGEAHRSIAGRAERERSSSAAPQENEVRSLGVCV